MLLDDTDYIDITEGRRKTHVKDLTEGQLRLIFSPARLEALQGDEFFFSWCSLE